MGEIAGSVWWLLVSLGVLVTFHEFGHFYVARRLGVRVLKFSIGFGPSLWSRTAKDGTEYAIAALPLGGYVRMLDEREADVPASRLHEAFNRKPVWVRIAIVAAGPLANLLLCVALLWAMFVIGRPDYAPVLGAVEGIAADAGFRPGDTLVAVGERATPTWSEAGQALLSAALDRSDVRVQVRDADGVARTRLLPLSSLPATIDERRAVEHTGLVPRHRIAPPVVGAVPADGPAHGIVRPGDVIVRVAGTPVRQWDEIAGVVQRAAAASPRVVLDIERDGEPLAVTLEAQRRTQGDATRWVLGIAAPNVRAPHDAVLRLSPLAAVPAAFAEVVHQARELVAMIGRAFTGAVSLQNTVAGPITIGRAANAYAGEGVAWFLSLLAKLSLSLGILNLLPIPILDGGHLLYYLIELVKGSPVSERVMAAGQFVGLALIAALMGLAFYNDIVNNLLR